MDHSAYFEYLRRRSRLGHAYRRYFLYPRLCRHLEGRVLDVGCGVGDFLAYRPDTIGVDINLNTVEWCRSHGLDARLMQPGSLPFDNAVFQGAIMDNVLEHIGQPEQILAEVRRVLRPGGHFVVGVPGRRGYDSDPDHRHFYDELELIDTLLRAGFTLLTLFHTPFRSGWLDKTMRQYCLYGVFHAQ